MKSLKDQIKDHEIGNLYLLFGEEQFLVKLNTQRIRKALLTEDDEIMNLEIMDAPTDMDMVKTSIETLPFMAERRVVIIKDSKAFSGKSSEKALTGLETVVDTIPETTTVIFVEEDVDKRSRLYKKVQAKEQAYEFQHQDDSVLSQWIISDLRKQRHTISNNDTAYLLSLTGSDMEHIQAEMQKLVSFVGERATIERKDIDLVVVPTIEASVFKMIDHLCEGRTSAAFELYKNLLKQSEPAPRIFFMIIRQFRILYKASLMERMDGASMAKELGVPPFAVKNYQRQVKHLGKEKLEKILDTLLEMDVKTKTGFMTAEEAIELIILNYVQ